MIMLDDRFRILVDSSRQNFILEKLDDIKDKETKETKQEWVKVGFFGSNFSSVLKRYKDEAILNEEQNLPVNQILNKLLTIDENIHKAVKAAKIKLIGKNDEV